MLSYQLRLDVYLIPSLLYITLLQESNLLPSKLIQNSHFQILCDIIYLYERQIFDAGGQKGLKMLYCDIKISKIAFLSSYKYRLIGCLVG